MKSAFVRSSSTRELGVQEFRWDFNITVDVVPPSPGLITPPNGSAVNTSSVLLTVASDPDTVSLSVNGAPASKLPGFSGDRPWGISLTFAEGTHLLEVVAVDHVGNRGLLGVQITIDLTPPSPITEGIFDGMEVNRSLVAVHIVTDPMDAVDLDNVVQSGVDGEYDITLMLATGESTHVLIVTDRAGNLASFTYRTVLDPFPPSAVFEPPFSGGGTHYINWSDVSIPVRTSADAALVEIGGISAVPDASWVAHVVLTLVEGPHDLVAVVTDRAGNRAEAHLSVVVDLTTPSISLIEPPSGSPVSIRFAVVQVGFSEQLASIRWDGHSATEPSRGTNIVLSVFDGLNSYELVLIDLAGNRNASTYEIVAG